MRIVIADDTKLIRDQLRTTIDEIAGADIVGEAADGREALSIIREEIPDLAILDIHMPGKTGISVLYEIKQQFPDMTVIMLTNYNYLQYRTMCMDTGADYFFDKSKEFNLVQGVIESLISESS